MSVLKRQLAKQFPNLAAAYQTTRLRREFRKYPAIKTPMGFYFQGHGAMQRGEFEADETKLIQQMCNQIDVYVDVGANVGYFVCIARALGRHVIAVEPSPTNLEYLYANLRLNGWNDVEVWPLGLGEGPGMADLYGGGTGASLLKHWAGDSGLLAHTISINTLDNLLGDRFVGKRVMIKIDVEGSEFELLRGASRTLTMTPAPCWLVEICLTEHHAEGWNNNFLRTYEEFYSRGYVAHTIDSTRKSITRTDIERWSATRKRDFGSANCIFSKPG